MARMDRISEGAHHVLDNMLPHLRIVCSDGLMSSVHISGSLDAPETWVNKIFENSRHFRFSITPMDGKRWYEETDPKVTVELFQCCYKIKTRFRKYTGPWDNCLAKVREWVLAAQSEPQ